MESTLVIANDPAARAPGAIIRRAQYLGAKDVLKERLAEYSDEMKADCHAPLHIVEDEVNLHDFTAVFGAVPESPKDHNNSEVSARAIAKKKERTAAWLPDSLAKYNIQFDKWVARNADIFVAVAATGDLEMLDVLVKFAEDREALAGTVDWALVVEVAIVNGHQAVIEWVDHLPFLASHEALMVEGRRRGNDRLAANMVDTSIDMSKCYVNGDKNSHAQREEKSKQLYLSVLTSLTIMGIIRSFQESPAAIVSRFEWRLCVEKPLKVDQFDRFATLPRIAIVLGELTTLQSLYYASRHLDLPKLSFHNAMHFAACEGRLELLQWLHPLPGTEHKCRPDTMAMAVRCGWSDVVAWLHTHCPESEQSMSVHAINAAARSGLVGVLDTCLTLGIGEFTTETLHQAALYGQLPVLQLLHSHKPRLESVNFQHSMKLAMQGSHLPVIQWLHTEQHVVFDAELLPLALQVAGDQASAIAEYVWASTDRSSDWVTHCIIDSFDAICATGCKAAVEFALSLVDDEPAIARGLLAAVRQAASARSSASGEQDLARRFEVVNLLLPLCAGDGATLGAALKLAVDVSFKAVTRAILTTEGDMAPTDLHAAFVLAVDSKRHRHLPVLIEYGAHTHCPDALTLMVQHRVGTSLIGEVFPHRNRESAIRALQAARDVAYHASYLLQHEDQFYTERILWENMPVCLVSSYFRYVLRQGRPVDADAVACFAGVVQQRKSPLTLEEIERLMALGDTEMNELAGRFRDTLFGPKIWSVLSRQRKTRVIQYLGVDVPMTAEQRKEVLASAMDTNQLLIVELLYAPELWTVPKEMIAAQLEADNTAFVARMLEFEDAATDDVIFSALLAQLQATELGRRQDPEPRRAYSSAIDFGSVLLSLLVEKRPRHSQRLLEIAAEAGSMEAVEYLLNPRSGVQASDLRMLPAMAAAARRSGNTRVIQRLYEARREEAVTVASVRALPGAWTSQVLLPLLEQWDASVRAELDQERANASALFGFAPSSSTASAKKRRHPRK